MTEITHNHFSVIEVCLFVLAARPKVQDSAASSGLLPSLRGDTVTADLESGQLPLFNFQTLSLVTLGFLPGPKSMNLFLVWWPLTCSSTIYQAADSLNRQVFHLKAIFSSSRTQASVQLMTAEAWPSANPHRESTMYLAHGASGTRA